MSVFLCFFKYKGVHFQLPLQINGGGGETVEVTVLYVFQVRFGLKKVAVEKCVYMFTNGSGCKPVTNAKGN